MKKIDKYGFLLIMLRLGFRWISFCRKYVPWLIWNIDKLGSGLCYLIKYLVVLEYYVFMVILLSILTIISLIMEKVMSF
jgi:hypothetical protein